MALTKERKKQIISEYAKGKHDTGSVEVQVAMLTDRINGLMKHFETAKKDQHSRYGLIKLVGQRKKLLAYLQKLSPERYKELISRLDLRK